MAEQSSTPAPAGRPSEQVTPAPTPPAPQLGWLLQPGSSSVGLYIHVAADADELTPDVLQGLEQLIADAHGASTNRAMMTHTCGALKSCTENSSDCPGLRSCGRNGF